MRCKQMRLPARNTHYALSPLGIQKRPDAWHTAQEVDLCVASFRHRVCVGVCEGEAVLSAMQAEAMHATRKHTRLTAHCDTHTGAVCEYRTQQSGLLNGVQSENIQETLSPF